MSKKYGNKGKPRRVIRERLAVAQGGICPICEGGDLTADNGTLDRILPGSRGGTYALANLRLAHKKCNSRRGNGHESGDRPDPRGMRATVANRGEAITVDRVRGGCYGELTIE